MTSAIDSIPNELLFKILSFCDPVSVIRIRCLCKRLWSASKSRSVWLAQLDNECKTKGAHLAACEIDSMNDVELEETILKPFRLAALLTPESEFQPGTFQAQSFAHKSDISQLGSPITALLRSPQHAMLDQSGRFLVTADYSSPTRGLARFHIWDLKDSSRTPALVTSITRLFHSNGVACWARAIFTRDGKDPNTLDLYIVIYASSRSKSINSKLELLRLPIVSTPEEEFNSPDLEAVAELSLTSNWGSGLTYVINQDDLLLVLYPTAHAPVILLWDFVRHASAHWMLHRYYDIDGPRYFRMINHDLYLFIDGRLFHWNLLRGVTWSTMETIDLITTSKLQPDFVNPIVSNRLDRHISDGQVLIHRLDATHMDEIATSVLLFLGVIIQRLTGRASLAIYAIDDGGLDAPTTLQTILDVDLGRGEFAFTFLSDSAIVWTWRDDNCLYAKIQGLSHYYRHPSPSIISDLHWVKIPAPCRHLTDFTSLQVTMPQNHFSPCTRVFLRENREQCPTAFVLEWNPPL